jgi:hypothetical protein
MSPLRAGERRYAAYTRDTVTTTLRLTQDAYKATHLGRTPAETWAHERAIGVTSEAELYLIVGVVYDHAAQAKARARYHEIASPGSAGQHWPWTEGVR